MKKHEIGTCPKCKSEITYGVPNGIWENEMYFPISCEKCGFKGKEWYKIKFAGITDEKGNEIIKGDINLRGEKNYV
ncbi:MAG: hypothetical protein DRH15_05660 [Deltaproteobacteria bacterium]|nr:MAG: hypothetical protein DRH15_05660 [Deltaproteobacteria bacterium]